MKRALAAIALALAACGGGTTERGSTSTSAASGGSTSGTSGATSTNGTPGTTSAGSGTTSVGTGTTTVGTGSTTAGTSGTSGNLCSTQACVVYAETANDLYQVDPQNPQGGATRICTFGGDISSAAINDIAVDASGALYALSSSSLFRVNLAPTHQTCGSTRVTDVAGSSNYNALSFTIDGTLLAAGSDGVIAEIDLANGSSTVVGHFATGYASSGDFVALSDGRIFATATGGGSSDVIVQIGKDASGHYSQQAVIGSVGFSGVYGLGFWAGTLYGFDSAGDVLQIDPSTGAGTLLGNNSETWYGAGTTPNAPILQ